MSSADPSTGHLARDVDHGGERLERHVGDRLEQLLVAPAGLARLLVQVHRGVPALLEQRAQVAQQRRLALVGGLPVARGGDLVDADAGLARRAQVDRDARAGCGSARRPRARCARASAASASPWRSSERKRAYARSAAGEPASTPRKFGSCPPDAIAPFSTGSDPSGAVRSSWMWKRLICVFIETLGLGRKGRFLPFVSVGPVLRLPQGAARPGARSGGAVEGARRVA